MYSCMHSQPSTHGYVSGPPRPMHVAQVAVRLARGTLVCLDPACVPFSRIWCLFEWWTTLRVWGPGAGGGGCGGVWGCGGRGPRAGRELLGSEGEPIEGAAGHIALCCWNGTMRFCAPRRDRFHLLPQVRGLGCLTFLADPATRRQLGQLYQVS